MTPHPLVQVWLSLHGAEGYGWETTPHRQTRGEWNGHTMSLTPIEGRDEVLFAYAGPNYKAKGEWRLGQRWSHFFRYGEKRQQTIETLRRVCV